MQKRVTQFLDRFFSFSARKNYILEFSRPFASTRSIRSKSFPSPTSRPNPRNQAKIQFYQSDISNIRDTNSAISYLKRFSATEIPSKLRHLIRHFLKKGLSTETLHICATLFCILHNDYEICFGRDFYRDVFEDLVEAASFHQSNRFRGPLHYTQLNSLNSLVEDLLVDGYFAEGYPLDPRDAARLMSHYCSCEYGRLFKVMRIMKKISPSLWTEDMLDTAFRACAKDPNKTNAVTHVAWMLSECRNLNFLPSPFMFSVAISLHFLLDKQKEAQLLFDEFKSNLSLNPEKYNQKEENGPRIRYIHTLFLQKYLESGQVQKASELMQEMKKHGYFDIHAYYVLMKQLHKEEKYQAIIKLYKRTQNEEVQWTPWPARLVLKVMNRLGLEHDAYQLLGTLKKQGLSIDDKIWSEILKFVDWTTSSPIDALLLKLNTVIVTQDDYLALLKALINCGRKEAFDGLVNQLMNGMIPGVTPTVPLFTDLIRLAAISKEIEFGRRVLDTLAKSGLDRSTRELRFWTNAFEFRERQQKRKK